MCCRISRRVLATTKSSYGGAVLLTSRNFGRKTQIWLEKCAVKFLLNTGISKKGCKDVKLFGNILYKDLDFLIK
jgi:hypothetical protein